MKRRFRYSVIPLAICHVVFVAAICHGEPNSNTELVQGAPNEPAYFYANHIETDKAIYGPGELVNVVQGLKNVGSSTIRFRSGNPMFDLEVWREDELVWQWSYGKAFLGNILFLTLEPDEAVETVYREDSSIPDVRAPWALEYNNGQPVEPGTYEVRAVNLSWPGDDTLEGVPVSVSITVVPEPCSGMLSLLGLAVLAGTRRLRRRK